jgi:hypothetical protein
LSGIVQGWRQAHELVSRIVVGGIVAADAISSREQFFSLGLDLLGAKIAAEEWNKLLQNIQEFESLFISTFQDATLCAVFVFQFQPIDQHPGNLLVHVVSSHIGKALPGIILKLEEVVESCEKHNLLVVARSFDGDNSYHGYHVEIAKYSREIMPRFEQGTKRSRTAG